MQNFFRYARVTLLFFCLFLTGRMTAQEDSTRMQQLSEVEVLGVKRSTTTREAAPIQRLNTSAFERLGTNDLSEAVKRFSGATVQDYGGIGGLKTVSVRSLGAKHTAVAYDGVTLTDAQSGQVDISRFSLDNVDEVALSAGLTDQIFQTARMFASAGALSIQTRKPQLAGKPMRLTALMKAGSFGWINPMLRYEQRFGMRYALTLDGDYQRADSRYPYTFTNGAIVSEEKRKNSDIESYHAEINLFADWQTKGTFQLKGYMFNSDRGLPGSVILYNDYHTERLKNRNAFLQGHYQTQLHSKLSLKLVGKFDYAWTRYRDYHNQYLDGMQQDVYTQREYYGSASLYYTFAPGWSASLAEDLFYNTLDATTPKCPFPERLTSLTALAVQYQNNRLTTTASLLATYMHETLEIGEAAADRKKLSPAISVSYRLLADHNLRARTSFKHSYRMPTFNDLYFDRIGNKNLDPEQAFQYNAGLTWSGEIAPLAMDYLSITVDGYYNQVKDKIVALPTMFIWKMMNMGKVNIGGIDANLSTHFRLPASCALLLDASYTWQHAVDRTKRDSKIYGHQIPYTPRHAGSLSLTLENPWLNLSWSLNGVSDRYALPQNTADNRIPGYVEQQVSCNRTFALKQCKLRLQAEVLNIGDVTYDVIRYYPMPGRSFRASIRIVY